MKDTPEITDSELANLRAYLDWQPDIIQSLVARIDRVERERDTARAEAHSLRVNEKDINEKVGRQSGMLADLRAKLAATRRGIVWREM
jgi:chromosome segregation ATPase